MNFSSNNLAPGYTPKIIKTLISLFVIFNLFSAIINHEYVRYFLGLSLDGIKNYYFWQIITNLFVFGNPTITFSFVFKLLFCIYTIWIFGTSITELKGTKQFMIIFSFASILSSFFALCFLYIFPSTHVFFGGTILLYVISMQWLMIHSDAKILLFFALPFNAKWIILGGMGINLLSLLSEGFYLYFSTYLFSAISTYLLCLMIWKIHSPFSFLRKIEKNIFFYFHKTKKSSHKEFQPTKIFDFKTGQPIIDDDEFMDSMLNRISLYGEDILTKKERKRMEKISKKKQKNPR